MDALDAINLLKKYGLYEDAQNECKSRKIDEAPYDMQGHNKVYCQFLDKKYVELKKMAEAKMKGRCVNVEALKSQNSMSDECFFNRVTFNKNGYCTECSMGKELTKIEAEMSALSEAARVLRETAERDYYLR